MTTSATEGTVGTVTDATFASEVLAHDKPVLVDFWAQWCGPCRMMAPVLAQLAEERAESLTVVKINADENPVAVRDYGVMGLPTMLLFRDGQPVRSIVGARPKARLLAELDDALR
jgi:thioredoxin 1